MFEPSRLRPLIRVGCVAVVLFLVLNSAFTALSSWAPGWLPRPFFGVDFIEDNQRRAVAAAEQYRRKEVDESEPLVVVLGLSSASEGISLDTLSEETGGEIRFLGLSGAGRNMEEVSLYAQPLLETGLKPDLVVFAINPFHLIDGYVHDDRSGVEMYGLWFYHRRRDIRHVVDLGLLDLRSRIFRLFDVRMEEALPDPWREMVRLNLPATTSERALKRKLEQYGERGYYEPEAYRRSTRQIASLIGLIRQFEQRGAESLIVLMPQHSALRERVPSAGLELLTGGLKRDLGERAPPIVDLADAIGDDEFSDISHLDDRGRITLSRRLAATIRASIPDFPGR